MAQGRNKKLLSKRVKKGNKGYPIATVAFYGPNNVTASKVVCGIIKADGSEGESCPKCSFWKDRDRFSHEKIH